MPTVVGIKFDNTPKVYWFAAGDLQYKTDDRVIVETARGVEMGRVKTLPTEVDESKIVSPLKKVLRIASEQDLAKQAEYEAKRPETIKLAAEKIAERTLKMKVVDAQCTL